MITPALAYAQAPWTVTLTPTMNPLPVGSCAALHLTLLDEASRDVPRTPLGARVTIADFDISVTTPDGRSAAPQYIDAHHVSACGCKGASPGTVATVTATYPAQGLAAKARVPGVAFQKMATFTLAAPKGDVNPPACTLLASASVPQMPPTPVAVEPSATQVTTSAPAPAPAPEPAPTPAAPAPVRSALPAAAVSTAGTGSTTPGTTVGAAISIPLETAAPSKTAGGMAAVVPVNPAGFMAVQTGPGRVHLSWKAVSGVAYYGLFGPGLTLGGEQVMAGKTSFTATGVPSGSQRWTVGSYYLPGPVATSLATFPAASVNVITPTNPLRFWVEKERADQAHHQPIRLFWDRVSGADHYFVTGPMLPAPAPHENRFFSPTTWVSFLPAGIHTWTVRAVYAYDSLGTPASRGYFSTPAAEFTKTSYNPDFSPDVPKRYRVSVLGLHAVLDTGDDDLFKTDGKRDEIYVAAQICTAMRPAAGQLRPLPVCDSSRRSAVHGDVWNYPQRIKAGSASASGGIMSGDVIGLGPNGTTTGISEANPTFPFVLWEGTLLPGKEAIWISPSLWESDNNDQAVLQWQAGIGGIVQTSRELGTSVWNALGGGFQFPVIDNVKTCGEEQRMGFDRPIGTMRHYPSSTPGLLCRVIGLTREKADAVLAGSAQEPGKPLGVMTIEFNDVVVGHYLMYLKLERLP